MEYRNLYKWERAIPVDEMTYSEVRVRFAEVWDRVTADRSPIRLTRRGAESVEILAATEYDGLLVEAAHLLRSPANAERLLAALVRARGGEGEPQPLPVLRAAFDHAAGE